MNKWQQLAFTSHYQTAVAVERALDQGDTPDAKEGIQELIDALSRAEKRALRSQLSRLMLHVIKWKTQPDKRSRSWRASINNARREIAEIQEETPSLNRETIESMWSSCFASAKEDAEGEMNLATSVTKLSWKEVFEKEYKVEST
jgi:Tfp pilus assembly pilus retraction ATPase PilT